MNYMSVLDSDGRITIPLEIRKRLGLKAGDRIEFVTESERTFVRPAGTAVGNPFSEFIGIGSPGLQSIQEINDWIADLRNDE